MFSATPSCPSGPLFLLCYYDESGFPRPSCLGVGIRQSAPGVVAIPMSIAAPGNPPGAFFGTFGARRGLVSDPHPELSGTDRALVSGQIFLCRRFGAGLPRAPATVYPRPRFRSGRAVPRGAPPAVVFFSSPDDAWIPGDSSLQTAIDFRAGFHVRTRRRVLTATGLLALPMLRRRRRRN